MKTKTLISFAVTVKLICVFVFAYAKCCVSHDAAQIQNTINLIGLPLSMDFVVVGFFLLEIKVLLFEL